MRIAKHWVLHRTDRHEGRHPWMGVTVDVFTSPRHPGVFRSISFRHSDGRMRESWTVENSALLFNTLKDVVAWQTMNRAFAQAGAA